jgi:hypothetical protein
MTEAEARTLLRNFDGLDSFGVIDSLESWTADQPWRKTQGDWSIPLASDGWHFYMQPVPRGLRVCATPPDGRPPVLWIVPKP